MTKPFRPMLAGVADLAKLRFPLLASHKLDGVRCIVIDGVVMSRTLKPIPNPAVQAAFGHTLLNGLDGELIVGDPTAPDCYRITVGGVMRREGDPQAQFYVFDTARYPDATFLARASFIRERLLNGPGRIEGIVVVPQFHVTDLTALLELEAEALEQGHEGLMLRDPQGLYKQGRSTVKEGGLLKLKRFEDSEAEILEVVQGMKNGNEATKNALGRTERSSHQAGMIPLDTAGALRVRDIATGCEFNIGTGFNAAEALDFWQNRERYVGDIVKYQHFAVGAKDKPRFPSFKGMRNPIDIGDPA